MYQALRTYLKNVANFVSNDDHIVAEMIEKVDSALRVNFENAEKELKLLCEDERQQPITYNHYYTDNVQQAHRDTTREVIKKAMKEVSIEEYNGKMHISNNGVDANKLLGALHRRVVVDMDEQACAEALAALAAYYKVIRSIHSVRLMLTYHRWPGKRSWITYANK